jgi:hypothetical protein
MGNSHVTILNDPSSGVKSDAPNCSVTYDRHYDGRNSFIIQATEDLKKISPNFSKSSPIFQKFCPIFQKVAQFFKNLANFSKSSQKSVQVKNVLNIYIKAQFESPKHLHQTTFETLKYVQQTMF